MQATLTTLATASVTRGAASADARRFRFFLWSDMHFRGPGVPGRAPNYPFANEKALWALECAQGKHGFERPDLVVSAGDTIDGEIPDHGVDFTAFRTDVIEKLAAPFLPCLGNHENRQGEGIPAQNAAYDRAFAPRWHNYVFTCGGIGFLVVDTSGAHHVDDEVTAARSAFIRRAFERLEGLPVIVVTHVPLVAMRDVETLKASFGFETWKALDPGVLRLVEERRDRAIAVLCGHLHLTGVRRQQGIVHICCAGTCGYPADFASFDVFDDRVEIQMHGAPEQWLDRGGDIHGKPRWPVDYHDAEHPDHESYVWGNPDERALTIRLRGHKRPDEQAPPELAVFCESAPGRWESARAG